MSGGAKKWYVEDAQGRVVRATPAGMILSDGSNEPSLYDHQTAIKVAEQLSGMLSLQGVSIVLTAKTTEARA